MQFRLAIFMAIGIQLLGCDQKASKVESLTSKATQLMTLEEYLQDTNNKMPGAGVMGVETDWMPVSTLKLTSGRLWLGDPEFVWAEANDGSGCVIELPQGIYVVEAKGIDFQGSHYSSRVRVYLQGSERVTVGSPFGSAGTDSAAIGIADQKAIKASLDTVFGTDIDAMLKLIEVHWTTSVGVIDPEPSGDGRLVYMQSGFGDCGGPALRLLSGNQPVGLEFEFINAKEPRR